MSSSRRDVKSTAVLVTGAPGSGKSTLARELSTALRLPYLARDDVRGGLLFSEGAWGDAVERIPAGEEAVTLFLETVELMLTRGSSCILEYVVRARHRAHLDRISAVSNCFVIRTHCDDSIERFTDRNRRDRLISNETLLQAAGYDSVEAHTTAAVERMRQVERDMLTDFPGPTLDVETTRGYEPTFEEILSFITGPFEETGAKPR